LAQVASSRSYNLRIGHPQPRFASSTSSRPPRHTTHLYGQTVQAS
jgi:hypothetical protein